MRPPSSRCLVNRVDLYRFTPTRDAAGGVGGDPYTTPFATDVACSVQPAPPERGFDNDTGRLIQKNRFNVVFRGHHALNLDDKVFWVDSSGSPHHLYVQGAADQAGRGAAFVVSCEERL